ncbi:type II toxin-antitoxin system RelE/ParE family toxin [uncultured Nisaea sp.]|uniref:type II toxin-antitoxin system RelE/ParE family toxin n=1 Tax=uncultured Nisaea sp. TaxID=538215 RepID=UPI0030EC8544
MTGYRITGQARAEIKEIIRYTDRNFGSAQTQEYLDGLFYSFELLADNPELGRVWAAGKRRYIYREHVVYYRLTGSGPLITQIRHGAMA